ncbi:MAG: hypothetical protein PHY48_06850 [Candidatus Cloacimonetes bacterium]|nr:hypothetical protein [Candidatus Cloacimonadota bacterium]
MPKHRKMIMEEIDPQSVEGCTDAQKMFYESMGYKPYLNTSNKVVWLSPELHSLRIHAKQRRTFLQRPIFKKKVLVPVRKKHRSWISKFFKNNWLFFLIIVGLMAFVLAYMKQYF